MTQEQYFFWQIIATILGSGVVLVGIIISIIRVNKGQKNNLETLKHQVKAQLEQIEVQYRNSFQKSFWETQLELYIEAVSNAAKLTQEDINSEKYIEARKEFYRLFWGPMSIVEDNDVKLAMEDFSTKLIRYEKEKESQYELMQTSFRLAKACRNSSIDRLDLKKELKNYDESVDKQQQKISKMK